MRAKSAARRPLARVPRPGRRIGRSTRRAGRRGGRAAGWHLLPLGPNTSWQHDELLEGLKRKVGEIEALQLRLEQNKTQLLVAIDSIENRPAGLQCVENTQWVLNRLREEGSVAPPGEPRAKTAG